ncbi:MAG: nucleoside hydrolase [Christensenellaceae bacterium]|nr:nucleoside hydrolase [Christensenellaceae bacterium]
MNKIPMIIDCDPGCDDAIALAMALFCDKVQVRLITTVGSNRPIKVATENALRILSVFNKNIEVAQGAVSPLIKKFEGIGADIKPIESLKNYVYDGLFTGSPIEEEASGAIRRVLLQSKEKVTILCLGPLTNIANLITYHKDALSKIDRIVLMGGSINGKGNATQYAEFNFYADPHAVQVVLNSGLNVDIVPIQAADDLVFTPSAINALTKHSKTGELLASLMYSKDAIFSGKLSKIYDPIAFMYVVYPELFAGVSAKCWLEFDSSRPGLAYFDEKAKPNCTVVHAINPKGIKEAFFDLVEPLRIQTEQTIPIIMDVDPGVDDAFAIAYAIGSDKVRTELLSVTAGNTEIGVTLNNTLHITDLLKRPTPVVKGASKPLKAESRYATQLGVYQADDVGLCGYKYDPKTIKAKPINGDAADVIYKKLIQNGAQKTTIIAIAPMTNIALLLSKYKDAKKYIKQIVFMGGSKEIVYGRPYKEFNIAFDPDAVEIVLGSGVPLVMVPMELGHFAFLDSVDIKRLSKVGTVGKALAKMTEGYKDRHMGDFGAATHDSTAVAYVVAPEIVKTEKAFINLERVKGIGKEEIAHVAVDFKSKKPNALVCVDMDISKFKEDLFKAIANLPK